MKNVKKTKNKVILIALIAMLVLSICAFIGCAEDPTGDQNPPAETGIKYELKADNTYKVTEYSGSESAIVIPGTHEGLPVTEIGYGAFDGVETLNEITIPESIVIIEDNAFSNCKNLKKVNYNAKRLDEGFDSNDSPFDFNTLSSSGAAPTEFVVNIGSNVEEIPDSIFDAIGVTELNFIGSSKCEVIGKNAFSYSQLTSLSLPDGIKTLKYGAFYDSEELVTVSIPSSIEIIETNVFSSCSKITGTEFENGVYIGNTENPYFALIKTTIDSENTVVNVHENTKFILSRAINGEFDLTEVNLPDGLKGICGYSISASSNFNDIVIPDSVEYVGGYAFDCAFLVVNCEAESKPSGWDDAWFKITNYPNEVELVNWGYQE